MRVFRTTVSGTDSKAVFNCAGGTSYPLGSGFTFMEETDLVVVRVLNGAETVLSLTTDYTVSGGDGATGTVATVETYTDGQLVVYRDTSAIQSYDAEVGDGFDTNTFERQLDRMTMVIQDQARRVEAAVRFADSSTLDGDAVLPSPSPGKALIWNTEGTGFANGGTSIGTGSLAVLESYAEMKSVASPGGAVVVRGRSTVNDGGEGVFIWNGADLSSEVSGDPLGGVYVPPKSNTTGTSGAWVRQHSGAFNPCWFGATGDGTTDDTTAIQSAINAADQVSGRGAVHFPTGSFKVTSTLSVSGNLILSGDGFGSEILAAASLVKLLSADASTNIVIRDLQFNGTGTTSAVCLEFLGGINNELIVINRCRFLAFDIAIDLWTDSFSITDNYAYYCTTFAKGSNASMNAHISGNYVLGGNHSVHITRTDQEAEGLRILNNTFLNTGAGAKAIWLEASLEVVIANNIIDQTGVGGYGIYVQKQVGWQNNSIKVLNNWIDCGTIGGQSAYFKDVVNLWIEGNTIANRDGSGTGITIDTCDPYWLINNNWINPVSTPWTLLSSDYGTIHGNRYEPAPDTEAFENNASHAEIWIGHPADPSCKMRTDGDFQSMRDGKGILVTSPDGLITLRIGIDNTGAIVTSVP